jgi:hypothetical protein
LSLPPQNLGFFESLNGILPWVGVVVAVIVASVIFIWYTKKYTPEIARTFIKAFHSRGLPVFIQDEMGNVALHICDKKFPEGVIHIKGKGWYLLPSPPSPDDPEEDDEIEAIEAEKRGPGRPPKPKASKPIETMSAAEKEAYVLAYGMLVQTPILRGFGKQVFFGSSVSSAVSNLTAIAHADLLAVRKLSPKMYQKTQLDALATGSRIEGQRMAGKETTKLIMLAIIVIAPIAVVGLIVYLLTQPRTGAAIVLLLGLLH